MRVRFLSEGIFAQAPAPTIAGFIGCLSRNNQPDPEANSDNDQKNAPDNTDGTTFTDLLYTKDWQHNHQ